MLKAENVTVRYGARTVVQDLSFELKEGEWLMLVGPNGAGKSTLIEAIAGGVPYAGKITLAGRNIRAFRASELARRIGVLAQKNAVSYAYSVEEVVSLGRYAHASGFLASRDDDGGERVERALELTGLTELRRAMVSVVHDLSLARKYGTHAVLMHRGQCAAQGKIGDVMTAEKLQAVYEMDVYGWMREMLGQWA